MKRSSIIAAVAVALAVGAAACRQLMPTNRLLQPRSTPRISMSTAEARDAFNHAGHEKTFAAAGVRCLDCHQFSLTIDTGETQIAEALSAHALRGGSTACHFCHSSDSPGKMAGAPSDCRSCHENLAPLRPADHEIAWIKMHGASARNNPVECESCHRQSQCIDCHERRDSVQTLGHERNFRFLHGIEARANPMQCSACHRPDYCINCHIEGNVVP
jgi:hypothetical protein